jgi:hypothetical protein
MVKAKEQPRVAVVTADLNELLYAAREVIRDYSQDAVISRLGKAYEQLTGRKAA